MASDKFTRAVGRGLDDIRNKLIDEAFFGRSGALDPGAGTERVLQDKLHPDKSGERGWLGWLQADHHREAAAELPPHGADHDLDR